MNLIKAMHNKKLSIFKRKIYFKLRVPGFYYLSASKLPVLDKSVLLEAGQGQNLNGNMFSIARHICSQQEAQGWQIYWTLADTCMLEEAQERFKEYDCRVQFVIRDSKDYCNILARAKFLLTDNSFPVYFSKRKEQIYLNTWHGTPLKTLGRKNISSVLSIPNIQKNFLSADYVLFPNELTKDVFLDDYMLRPVLENKLVMADYPRNDVFSDTDWQSKLRHKLGLRDKQLIAYLPTWRGNQEKVSIEEQRMLLLNLLDFLDKGLREEQELYVNLHFLMETFVDYKKYRHIKPFPGQYETYDFLSIVDILITDYSSVIFDFAITKRPIVLYAYDLDDYRQKHGLNLQMQEMPFPIAQTPERLLQLLQDPVLADNVANAAFLDRYATFRNKDTTKRLWSLLSEDNNLGLEIKKIHPAHSWVLVYLGDLQQSGDYSKLAQKVKIIAKQYNGYKLILCCRGRITRTQILFLESLHEAAGYLLLTEPNILRPVQWLKARLGWNSNVLKKEFKRERERICPNLQPVLVLDCSLRQDLTSKYLKTFTDNCEYKIWK